MGKDLPDCWNVEVGNRSRSVKSGQAGTGCDFGTKVGEDLTVHMSEQGSLKVARISRPSLLLLSDGDAGESVPFPGVWNRFVDVPA